MAVILIGGRPYEMAEVEALSDAILCAFYPGPTGGEALAKLLFGELSPAGRLPVSLPDHAGQLPVYYNYKDSYQGMRYWDAGRPRYPFGSGLTYSRFDWKLISPPGDTPDGEGASVTFAVRNAGDRASCAVPQLHLHRTQGVTASRRRALCAFDKVYLEPGEEKTVTLVIPRENLCQWDAGMRQVLPPGKIEWFLCDGGETLLEGSFTVGT